MRSNLSQPRRILGPRLAIGLISAITIPTLGAAVVAQYAAGIPVRILLSDLHALVDLPFYAGLISYMGILGWAAAATICLFSFVLIDRQHAEERAFLLRAGLLTGLLCIDDLIGLHERALPAAGVLELVTYGSYAAITLAHFGLSLGPIRLSQWWILLLAVAFFAVSVVSEMLVHFPPEDSLLRVAEEGAKFVGIVAWFLYHMDTAARFLYLDARE